MALIPPLRTRGDDLPLLVKHFIGWVARELGNIPTVPIELSGKARKAGKMHINVMTG